MRNPSRFCARRRAAALCLAAALGSFLAACAPGPRLYGRLPRTADDGVFPWDRVDIVSFEDDTRRKLVANEYVALESEELVLHTADGDREILDLDLVDAVRLVPVDGVAEWLDVLTLDDLADFDRLPAVARIELRDGSSVVPNPDAGERVTWSPERLSVVVSTGVDDDDPRSILLDEVDLIELREGASFVQTLKSPMFWIAGAAATGAIILIGRGRGSRDTNATS